MFIINNDKKHYMSWEHWPFNNCLGTLVSLHCNNTLFKMGVQNLGCYIPSPLFWHYPQCIYKIEIKISNLFKTLWVLYLHGIFMLPGSIFKTIVVPLNFYHLYNSILEHFDFFVQYLHWLNLKISLCLYLNQMQINNMVRIMYIFIY
jgi:hypothetical protein